MTHAPVPQTQVVEAEAAAKARELAAEEAHAALRSSMAEMEAGLKQLEQNIHEEVSRELQVVKEQVTESTLTELRLNCT